MTYPISRINGIGPPIASKLKTLRIRTTSRFLEEARNPKGREALAAKLGQDRARVLRWANKADMMRIKGIGDDYAELLAAAGVDTVRELRHRNPKKLARAMAKANASKRLVRFLPGEKAITRWIAQANALTLKITY